CAGIGAATFGRRGRPVEAVMPNRFTHAVLLGILVLLAVLAVEPYVMERLNSATTPRPVEPRRDLADFQRATIQIFERVSPSVVQVAGQVGNGDLSSQMGEATGEPGEQGAVQSGTGFIWDRAGHIVTNNHVVQGASSLMVRLASGEVGNADVVGT